MCAAFPGICVSVDIPCYMSKFAATCPRILTNERSTKTMSTELTNNCRPILVYIHGIQIDWKLPLWRFGADHMRETRWPIPFAVLGVGNSPARSAWNVL